MEINSHDGFSHDSIDALGYDWTRVGNPVHPDNPDPAAPVHPGKVYFPTNKAEVQAAVKDVAGNLDAADQLVFGETVMIRGKGHSSNKLVLGQSPATPVISTERLNGEPSLSTLNGEKVVRVLAGTELGELDKWLEDKQKGNGYGLPVMPDHSHISVGGFCAVGGISPASHIHGLFVDTVRWISYVGPNGASYTASPGDPMFRKLLAGTGRDGIIVELKCLVIKVRKSKELLTLVSKGGEEAGTVEKPFEDPGEYVKAMQALVSNPPKSHVKYQRGLWARIPALATPPFREIGLIAKYKPVGPPETKPDIDQWDKRNKDIAKLHGIGALAGNLPENIAELEAALKSLGINRLLSPLPYATYADVETLIDKVIDASVGSPTHMVSMFVPAEEFTTVFQQVRALCDAASNPRSKTRFLAAYSIYSRAIRSKYLAGSTSGAYVDLSLYMILIPVPGAWPAACKAVSTMIGAIDKLCDEHNSSGTDRPCFRYMCTETSFAAAADDSRNPNQRYRP